MHKFQKQAKETGKIKLFEGSESFKRDFVFVEDLCEMHEKMLEKHTSGIFNAGTGTVSSFSAIAASIAKKYDASIELIEMPSALKPQYQKYTRADISLLLQHIDIEWTDVHDYIACLK